MKILCYLLSALMGASNISFAQPDLILGSSGIPATIVVRVNRNTNAVEVFHSSEKIPANIEAISEISDRDFVPVSLNRSVRNELDRDTSRSSWFWVLALGVVAGYIWGHYNGSRDHYPYPVTPHYQHGNQAYAYNPYYYNYSYPYNYYFYRF